MAKGAAFFVLVLALSLVFLMDSAHSDQEAYDAGRKVKDTAYEIKDKAQDFLKGIFGRLVKHNHQSHHEHQHHRVHGPAATPTPTPAPAPAETPKAAKDKATPKAVKAKAPSHA